MAEDVSAAGDDAHRALHDRRQEHDVVAVVNDEVRIDLLGSQEEIGDLRRVDTGLVLHADDVGDGGQTADGLRLEVDTDEDGDVVEHDVRLCVLGDRLIMQIQAFLRGLVVERADDEGQLDAEVMGLVRQGDGLLRGGAAGACNDGLTAWSRTASRARRTSAGKLRRWCR